MSWLFERFEYAIWATKLQCGKLAAPAVDCIYLQVVDKGKQLQLGSFGHSVRITLASILGHCAAVLAAIWGFLTALAAQPLRGRSKTHLPGAVQEAERPTAQVLQMSKSAAGILTWHAASVQVYAI